MLFLEYPPCSTCKKARKWLDDHGLSYEARNIKTENPNASELAQWLQASGLPLKKFFNTSGNVYKALHLAEKLPEMSQEEQLRLLATDGMLVKRPLIVTDQLVLVGFRPEQWEQALLPGDSRE